jgi:hypothetical protein
VNGGPALGTPFLDVNAIFKVGKLISDKIPPIHDFVNSDPFVAGLLGHLTIGEAGAYDYTHGRWFDDTWVGVTAKF